MTLYLVTDRFGGATVQSFISVDQIENELDDNPKRVIAVMSNRKYVELSQGDNNCCYWRGFHVHVDQHPALPLWFADYRNGVFHNLDELRKAMSQYIAKMNNPVYLDDMGEAIDDSKEINISTHPSKCCPKPPVDALYMTPSAWEQAIVDKDLFYKAHEELNRRKNKMKITREPERIDVSKIAPGDIIHDKDGDVYFRLIKNTEIASIPRWLLVKMDDGTLYDSSVALGLKKLLDDNGLLNPDDTEIIPSKKAELILHTKERQNEDY